jgi:hypothetical protein
MGSRADLVRRQGDAQRTGVSVRVVRVALRRRRRRIGLRDSRTIRPSQARGRCVLFCSFVLFFFLLVR